MAINVCLSEITLNKETIILFTAVLSSPSLLQLPIRLPQTEKVKGFLLVFKGFDLTDTHKRPSDHLSTDPVGPLCLVRSYTYTLSLWGFRTLLLSPLLLSFTPSSSSSFSFSSSAVWCFLTSEYRHVVSFGAPGGPGSRQSEKNQETPLCPRCKSYLTIITGELLLNITKRLDGQRGTQDCLVCCSHQTPAKPIKTYL